MVFDLKIYIYGKKTDVKKYGSKHAKQIHKWKSSRIMIAR